MTKGVNVTCEGRNGYLVMSPENDGHIPRLDSAKDVVIRIKIEPGISACGFYVHRKGDIESAKEKNCSQGGKLYKRKVSIRINIKEEKPYTSYPHNHICLLCFDGNNFAIHKIAVIFQNGEGFLTNQKVYKGSVFQSGKGLFCPEFDGKWPQLVTFLESIYKQNGNGIGNLPCFEGYNPFVKKADGINLDDNVGIVKWFDVAQGFGAISTNKGDAFVHYKDIDSEGRLICLDVGDMVLFEKLIPNTSDQGSFSYKAVGVLAPEA